jgi:hypothetical protein
MDTLKIVVGNTVDLFIDVEGMSSSPDEAMIEIYKAKRYPDGLQELIETIPPTQISEGAIQFTFDTDQLAPVPSKLYGRLFVNDSGKKINAYFKMVFSY